LKIFLVELYAFDLPLRASLMMGGRTIDTRQGLLVALCDEHGHRGFGEAAPLPGFQKETLNGCRDQLLSLALELKGRTVPGDVLELNGALSVFLPESRQLYPAVRFALESALVNLAAAAKSDILAAALNPAFVRQIRLNGLLSGERRDMVRQAQKLAEQGYACLKMKVGRQAPVRERERVLEILKALPATVKLRLDANRAWSLEQALEFAVGLPTERIEYIEEPLQKAEQLEMFYRRTHLSYALDESLLEKGTPQTVPAAGLAALVIKPAFLGSLEQSKRLIAFAAEQGLPAVLSDAFGSGVALSVLIALAAALIPSDTPMGFDTYRMLERDILLERIGIAEGRIDTAESGRRAQHIQLKGLERIL